MVFLPSLIHTEPFFEGSQATGEFRQTRFDRHHTAKDAKIDRRGAAHQCVIRQIIMNPALGYHSRAIANLNMVCAARLAPELTPLAKFSRTRQA
jgi:hypothetical protein